MGVRLLSCRLPRRRPSRYAVEGRGGDYSIVAKRGPKFTVTNVEAQTKRCPRCREVKPFSEFGTATSNQGTTRKAGFCKACFNEYQFQRRDRDRERFNNAGLKFHLIRACKTAGITLAQYQRALEDQMGLCKICHQPQRSGYHTRLSIDHDHVTGKFRGLLCSSCNSGLGHFGDDLALLEEAIQYLRAGKSLFQVIDGEAQ